MHNRCSPRWPRRRKGELRCRPMTRRRSKRERSGLASPALQRKLTQPRPKKIRREQNGSEMLRHSRSIRTRRRGGKSVPSASPKLRESTMPASQPRAPSSATCLVTCYVASLIQVSTQRCGCFWKLPSCCPKMRMGSLHEHARGAADDQFTVSDKQSRMHNHERL